MSMCQPHGQQERPNSPAPSCCRATPCTFALAAAPASASQCFCSCIAVSVPALANCHGAEFVAKDITELSKPSVFLSALVYVAPGKLSCSPFLKPRILKRIGLLRRDDGSH